MSKTCQICGRGVKTGISRSHSHVASKRKININLQTKKINGKRMKVCTKCLRKMAKPEMKRKKSAKN